MSTKIKVVLYDVVLRDSDDPEYSQKMSAKIGWVEGGYREELADAPFDSLCYYYFDDLSEIETMQCPYELDSDTIIDTVFRNDPETVFYEIKA